MAVNPMRPACVLPAVTGAARPDRLPRRGGGSLAVLPEGDRALWATAFYAGLRRGELHGASLGRRRPGGGRHPRRAIVGCEGASISSSRSPVPGRGGADRGSAPRSCFEHKLARQRRGDGYVFGAGVRALRRRRVQRGAHTLWGRPVLEPITLHESAHTFASLMIAAGVNAKALTHYMGHASDHRHLDRYGHLMPGNEDEAAGLSTPTSSGANTAAVSARSRALDPRSVEPRAAVRSPVVAPISTLSQGGLPTDHQWTEDVSRLYHQESGFGYRESRRRGRDLNPRDACTPNGFRDRPVRPLRHPSEAVSVTRASASAFQGRLRPSDILSVPRRSGRVAEGGALLRR